MQKQDMLIRILAITIILLLLICWISDYKRRIEFHHENEKFGKYMIENAQ